MIQMSVLYLFLFLLVEFLGEILFDVLMFCAFLGFEVCKVGLVICKGWGRVGIDGKWCVKALPPTKNPVCWPNPRGNDSQKCQKPVPLQSLICELCSSVCRKSREEIASCKWLSYLWFLGIFCCWSRSSYWGFCSIWYANACGKDQDQWLYLLVMWFHFLHLVYHRLCLHFCWFFSCYLHQVF